MHKARNTLPIARQRASGFIIPMVKSNNVVTLGDNDVIAAEIKSDLNRILRMYPFLKYQKDDNSLYCTMPT